MTKFYEKEFDYKNVHDIFNKIINEMELKKFLFPYEKLQEFNTPTFYSEIIPLLTKLYGNNSYLLDIISKEFNFENFNFHKISDLENMIIKDDYVILDNIIFFINPLSVEAKSIINGFKDYSEEELLFNKFGIIFQEQIKNLEDKKNLILKDKKFDLNELSLEKIFQDLIKNSIENKSSKIKIFNYNNEIKVHLYVDGQYLKNKEYSILKINNYEKFKNLIDEKFKNKILNWKYGNSYYNLYLKKDLNEDIYIEVFKLDVEIKKIKDISFKDKEYLSFINSLNQPSGVILISGKTDSGKRSLLYSILKHMNENRNGDNILSVENKIKNSMDFITQVEADKKENIKYDDFSIIAIDNDTSIKDLFNLASKGKFVIGLLESASIFNTLHIINEEVNNKYLIAENLLSVIHVGLFNLLCDSCSYEIKFNRTNNFNSFISLDNAPSLTDIIKEENKNGCTECNYGYSGRIQLCEIIENDNILKDLYLKDFNLNNFKTEKRSKSWNNIYENAISLVKEHKISLNSIIKSIGYYKK